MVAHYIGIDNGLLLDDQSAGRTTLSTRMS
jgi:hypothetical protein